MPIPITVDELLDAAAHGRGDVSAVRTMRRLDLGDQLALSFENRDSIVATLRHIVATEGMTDPEAVQAECDVYNSLLPIGGLSAQLGVRVPAGQSLRQVLQALSGLEAHLWLALGKARRGAQFFGPLAARQHVRFVLEAADWDLLLDPGIAARLLVDKPGYSYDVALPAALRRALWEDLQ